METISNKYSKTSSKSGDKLRKRAITRSLIRWYKSEHRDLPWRHTKDPYKIWISEIILQQTRVSQGLPYYNKFIQTFPTVKRLASADEDEVLRLWQGLGYYTRARNMHRCAKMIMKELNGEFPSDYSGLLKLPGIGKYTAAAIASIAFDEPKAVLDGNVFRVISRLFGIKKNIAEVRNRKLFDEKANELIPPSTPGDFNQAIMELGATLCKPNDPDCPLCPVRNYCTAHLKNMQHLMPVNSKKQLLKSRFFDYYVIQYRNKIVMHKREARDIWKGLYEFYLLEQSGNKSSRNSAGKAIKLLLKKFRPGKISKIYRSVLSHQLIEARFIHVCIESKNDLKYLMTNPGTGLFTPNEVELLPKPVLIDNYLKEGIF